LELFQAPLHVVKPFANVPFIVFEDPDLFLFTHGPPALAARAFFEMAFRPYRRRWRRPVLLVMGMFMMWHIFHLELFFNGP
jgi:hypothetical protein